MSRSGIFRSAMVMVVTAMAVTLLPTAAQASGAVSSTTRTLFDGCRDYTVNIAGSMPGAADWEYDVTLYSPSGESSSFDYDYGVGDVVDTVARFNICDFEGVGAYTIEGTLTWYDFDYNTIASDDLYGTLRMVRQSTRSSLRVSDATPAFNSRVRLTMRSTQLTPLGWRNNAYEYVALEVKCGGAWGRVRGSKTLTDAYGKAVRVYRWDLRRTCRIRTVTFPTVNAAVSRSTSVAVNPH